MRPESTAIRPADTSRSLKSRVGLIVTELLIVLSCWMLLAPPLNAGARAGPGEFRGKLVVLVVDRVGIQDFPSRETPFCAELAGRWSVGMMVTHTGEPEPEIIKSWTSYDIGNRGADYVTLGEGVRARGGRDAGLSFNSGERLNGFGGRTAGMVYSGFSGHPAPEGGVVCLGYPEILRNNKDAGNEENAGLLGRLLEKSRHIPAVVGNSDTLKRPFRFAPLICCDQRGSVPRGDVSDDTGTGAPGSPGGYRTSPARLIDESRRLLGVADMLVVDTGDTARIDRESGKLDPQLMKRERASRLKEVDRITRELVSLLDLKSSLLLLVSPGAPLQARGEGDYLTPFIAAGKGFGKGLLTSESARRPGLVNNVDFLPTALGFFGVQPPSQVVGTRMSTTRGPADTVEYLKELNRQFAVTRRARWPIVVAYAVIAALFACVAALCLPGINGRLHLPRDPRRLRAFLRPASLVLLSAPLSFVVVSAFRYRGFLFPALFCAGFSVAVGGVAWFLQRGGRRLDPFAAVCLLTSLIILADLFFSGRLVMIPLLGVSALEGLRMYGLTNILAGLLIAVFLWGVSGLAGDAVLRPGTTRWLVLAAMLALSFAIGFGGLGANAGSFIVALAVTLVFFTATSQRGFTPWRTAGIVALTAAGTVFMVLLDNLFVHTHAGKMVSGPPGRLLPLMGRKLTILFGQISFYLFPALILIVAVLALAIWFRRPGSLWEKRWGKEKLQTATLFSLVVGSLVALVFEDTGISMLAVMTLVSVLAMAYYLPAEPVEGGRAVLSTDG